MRDVSSSVLAVIRSDLRNPSNFEDRSKISPTPSAKCNGEINPEKKGSKICFEAIFRDHQTTI